MQEEGGSDDVVRLLSVVATSSYKSGPNSVRVICAKSPESGSHLQRSTARLSRLGPTSVLLQYFCDDRLQSDQFLRLE
jgi:hypothetical protein